MLLVNILLLVSVFHVAQCKLSHKTHLKAWLLLHVLSHYVPFSVLHILGLSFYSVGSRKLVLTALSATQINIFIIPRNEPNLRDYIAYNFQTGRQLSVAANAPLLEVTDSNVRSGAQNRYFVRGRYPWGSETSEVHAWMWPLSGSRKLKLHALQGSVFTVLMTCKYQ